MSIQAMKQALEALDVSQALLEKSCYHHRILSAYKELRAAISEQEKCEPVGYLCKVGLPMYQRTLLEGNDPAKWEPLYTHPAPVEKCEPVAWLNKKIPHMAVLTKPNAGGGWFPVFTHPAPVPVGMVLVKASSLLACRDALLDKDAGEAYHQLYWSVDWNDPYNPWLEWEAATPKGEMK
jgi:hypothetical protein